MNEEKFIQVGVTALRDPATHEYLPAVPLYIKATEESLVSQQKLIDDLGHLFALQFKEYMDGCADAGVSPT